MEDPTYRKYHKLVKAHFNDEVYNALINDKAGGVNLLDHTIANLPHLTPKKLINEINTLLPDLEY